MSKPTDRVAIGILALLAVTFLAAVPQVGWADTYYVRQTVGSDDNDGLSPDSAWKTISRLSTAMTAGDTVYIGPGLYREQVTVLNSGTAEERLTFIGDYTGQYTGDPAGAVMISGTNAVDESIFVPQGADGVYQAKIPYKVAGVVEMDSEQFRYRKARDTREHVTENMSLLDVVIKIPASHYYDEEEGVVYIHTSDGKPPTTHEIELIARGTGIGMWDKHYVTVMGFTIRHVGDGAVSFFHGSTNGIAIDNVLYGSRQGIRVYAATEILAYRNTFFKNDNSGIYFARASINGSAIANTSYENIKGVRWSSSSINGMALDNVLFDNRDAGISIEDVGNSIIRRNRMVNNKLTQLMAIRSKYDSNENCYDAAPGQMVADYVFIYHHPTLAEFQNEHHTDLDSREGDCGPLPAKIDVRKLHAETMAYTERARQLLSEAASAKTPEEKAAGEVDEGSAATEALLLDEDAIDKANLPEAPEEPADDDGK
jgi:parallel beta-helix repeat protein